MGNQADAVLGAKLSGKLLGPYLALGRGKQDCQRGKGRGGSRLRSARLS